MHIHNLEKWKCRIEPEQDNSTGRMFKRFVGVETVKPSRRNEITLYVINTVLLSQR